MRTARIGTTQMQQILNVLHTPGFELQRLAPTVYYLEKAERVVIPDTVKFFTVVEFNYNSDYIHEEVVKDESHNLLS